MRAKPNLTIERAVADEALALGVSMSRVAEQAIRTANKVRATVAGPTPTAPRSTPTCARSRRRATR